MNETITAQIERLDQALTRAADGTPAAADMPLLSTGHTARPLDETLQALNLALAQNMLQLIKNRHEQFAVGMAVSQYVTFFARQITPDVPFWTEEVNGDVALQTDLLLGAQQDVESLVANYAGDPAVQELNQRQSLLVSDFNDRQQRRIEGRTLYDAAEAPAARDTAQAEAVMRHLRQTQFREAMDGISLLTDRALIAIKRVHLVKATIMPLFQKAQDPAAPSWQKDIDVTRQQGQNALHEAENLHTHLARFHLFGRRLDQAKTPKPE